MRQAYQLLRDTPDLEIIAASHLYESAPWGYTEQPAFLNSVVHARTSLGPLQLLLRLQVIERTIGRTPTFRWGPREIDIDVLQHGESVIRRRGLILPHPRLAERAFVLVPLQEVSPCFRDVSGQHIDDLIARISPDSATIRRIEGKEGTYSSA
jgi:2-amino-4-hydroxy-6-hydroxymethyldihydropteridine diphosphokinase